MITCRIRGSAGAILVAALIASEPPAPICVAELTADERAAFLRASDKIRHSMSREGIQPAADAATM